MHRICSRDRFTFRRHRGTWLVEMHFSGALSSSGTENAPEISFPTPKPDHANAPVTCIHLFHIALLKLSHYPTMLYPLSYPTSYPIMLYPLSYPTIYPIMLYPLRYPTIP